MATRSSASQQASKGAVVSVRFTDDEFQRLKALSADRGMPVSALIRRAAMGPVVQSFVASSGGASVSQAGISVTQHDFSTPAQASFESTQQNINVPVI